MSIFRPRKSWEPEYLFGGCKADYGWGQATVLGKNAPLRPKIKTKLRKPRGKQ